MTDLTDLSRPDIVTVYGVDTCDDTTRARHHFDAAGLAYRYVNLDQDAAAKTRVNGAGYHATPVVVTPTGELLVEPSDDDLDGIVASVSRAATVTRDAASTTGQGDVR